MGTLGAQRLRPEPQAGQAVGAHSCGTGSDAVVCAAGSAAPWSSYALVLIHLTIAPASHGTPNCCNCMSTPGPMLSQPATATPPCHLRQLHMPPRHLPGSAMAPKLLRTKRALRS